MENKYLIRLDDACPYMDVRKWQHVENLLDKYGIKPLVGIIPANADSATMMDEEDPLFWDKVHHWIEKGWEMALHGYNHVCISDEGKNGLNPVWRRSEFAGVSLEVQKDKIRKGLAIMNENGVNPKFFFAPSHTFDENTLKALKDCSSIRFVSDMIATKPFQYYGLTFVPCQMGVLREMLIPGYWCACYHPNQMSGEDFNALEDFIKSHHQDFVSFSKIPNAGKRSLMDRILSIAYYLIRRIKG